MEEPTTEKHWIVFCFNFLTDYSQSGTSWSQIKGLMEQSLGAHHSCCREMRASYKRWHDSMLKLILEKRISFPLLDRVWIIQTENKGRAVKCESHSVMSDSLRPHGLYSPWNSPGQNTGVGSFSLLQGIFPTQGSNSGLPHCKQILYQLNHERSPYKWSKSTSLWTLECVITEVRYLIGGWWDGVYMVWFPVWSFFHCTKAPLIWQAV